MTNPMKDSGVEWIGEIPGNWNVKPIKYVLKSKKGLNITKADLVDNGVAVISYGQIHSKANNGVHISKELIRYISKENPNINYSALMGLGDIVFADTSEDYEGIGNAVLNDYREEIFAGYHTFIMTPKIKVNSKYLSYQFLTDEWRLQLRRLAFGVKVYSVTQKIINQSVVLLPSLNEQQAIADFLDKETKKLDDTKDLLQQQIEKLKEYRKSLIWETVTKGLDKSVPMKESGVEWIGEIPEGWEVKKIKYISSSDDEQVKTQDISFGKIIRYVDIGSVNLTEGITRYQEMSLLDAPSRARKIVRIGDTLVSTVRTYLKAITYIQDEKNVVVSTGFSVLRPKKMDSKFFNYCIMSDSFTKQVENVAWGIVYPSISNSNLVNLKISYPADVSEQKAIVKFLDEKISIIEQIINNAQSRIEVIDKQKKTLIYDYVTGKRRVQQ